MAVKTLPCTCKHEYQDKQYGKGNRVHNSGGGGKTGTPSYKCTVCGVKK